MNAKFLNAKDYDFLKENEYLGKNIILLGLGGSHAYGTDMEGSDIDVRGIAARRADDILLGNDFENIVDVTTDTTIYSLDKMCALLAECNPNSIEIISLKPDQYFYISEVGQRLLDNKSMFLSKRCINTFGGYANQQLYRLQQKSLIALSTEEYNAHIAKVLSSMREHLELRYGLAFEVSLDSNNEIVLHNSNSFDISAENISGILNEINNTIRQYSKTSKRNEKALAHNKINKHAMHLIRLYAMANDLLEYGEVVTYREKEHDLLMDIRNGKFEGPDGKPNKEFFNILKEYEAKFDVLKKTTKLPDEPDYKKINQFLVDVNRKVVMGAKGDR